jgi:hypothetical protein
MSGLPECLTKALVERYRIERERACCLTEGRWPPEQEEGSVALPS